jgi:hypothetical protein
MSAIVSLTHYSYLLCSGAALLAVIYFITQLPALKPGYRQLAIMNIIICGFSTLLHFFYFSSMGSSPDTATAVASITGHPLEIRYSYWLVTTVLLVSMFPLLIGLEKIGTRFLVQVAGADAAMIVCGFFGERSIQAAGEMTQTGILLFLAGCVAWLYMLVTIFVTLRRLPSRELTAPQRDTLAYMYFFVLLGWSIYPLGYFNTTFFDAAAGTVLREFTFNLGDIVNKIIWGIMVVAAARKVSDLERASA